MLVVPGLASAACPEQGGASAPSSVQGRAAGDDPVVTEPTDPTCDDAGYDIAFPDVTLQTDVEPTPTPATPIASGGGTLPVTGTTDSVFVLALAGMLLVNAGVLVLIASERRVEVDR